MRGQCGEGSSSRGSRGPRSSLPHKAAGAEIRGGGGGGGFSLQLNYFLSLFLSFWVSPSPPADTYRSSPPAALVHFTSWLRALLNLPWWAERVMDVTQPRQQTVNTSDRSCWAEGSFTAGCFKSFHFYIISTISFDKCFNFPPFQLACEMWIYKQMWAHTSTHTHISTHTHTHTHNHR